MGFANLQRKFSKTQKNRQQSCAKYFVWLLGYWDSYWLPA